MVVKITLLVKKKNGGSGTMKTLCRIPLFPVALFFCFIPSISAADTSIQLGAGYGFDVRNGAHLEQYEVFLRAPLPYNTTFFGMEVATAAELGVGYVQDWETSGSGATRFSIMPEVVLAPHNRFSFILGAGVGFLAGNTEFYGHDLGGPLLFTVKCGVQYHINGKWEVEDVFYHQSNGDIYSHNYSLNMNQLSLAYTF